MLTSLKILGHTYEVRGSANLLREHDTTGQCQNNQCWITIDTGAAPSHQSEVLLHEIFEALKYRLGLDIDHNALTALSEGLFQVLTDNGLRTDWGAK